MPPSPVLVALIYVVTGVLPLVLFPRVQRELAKPGARGLAIAIGGISIWSVANAAQILAGTCPVAVAAANVTLLGASLGGIGWFLLAGEYTGWIRLSRRVLVVLAVEPLLTQVLAWTNPFHQLVWGPETAIGPLGIVELQFGVVFWVHTIVLYLLIGVATLLLLGRVISSGTLHRRQGTALLAGAVPPLGVTTVYVWDLVDLPYDLTPFGFVLTAFLFGWALFEADFLTVLPVARQTAMERMNDAFVAVDRKGHVLDWNHAAVDLLDVEDPEAGMSSTAFFGAYPTLLGALRDPSNRVTEVTLEIDGEQRYFLLDVSPISRDADEFVDGRSIVIHEVTGIRRREEELRTRERELDVLRQLMSRVLRHDIRNDLTSMRARAEILDERTGGEFSDLTGAIINTTDEIAQLGEKARLIEKVIQQDDRYDLDLVTVVEREVANLRQRHPSVALTIETPDSCPVRAHPRLETAIENLLENAVEHNDAPEQSISIAVERDDEVTLVIEDNGPGIPTNELAVLDAAEETSLQHSSGIGLWLVTLVAEKSGIDIAFERTGTGSRVTLSFGSTPPQERLTDDPDRALQEPTREEC
jgi:signal transduction histidine kinase